MDQALSSAGLDVDALATLLVGASLDGDGGNQADTKGGHRAPQRAASAEAQSPEPLVQPQQAAQDGVLGAAFGAEQPHMLPGSLCLTPRVFKAQPGACVPPPPPIPVPAPRKHLRAHRHHQASASASPPGSSYLGSPPRAAGDVPCQTALLCVPLRLLVHPAKGPRRVAAQQQLAATLPRRPCHTWMGAGWPSPRRCWRRCSGAWRGCGAAGIRAAGPVPWGTNPTAHAAPWPPAGYPGDITTRVVGPCRRGGRRHATAPLDVHAARGDALHRLRTAD